MIEVEIINASYLSSKGSNGIDTYCVLKVFGKEVGRTSTVLNTFEPIWNEKFDRAHEDLAQLERIHNRPLFFEYIEVDIYEVTKSGPMKMYETRVPLINVNTFKGYKLLRPEHSLEHGRIFIRINLHSGTVPGYAQLVEACPPSSPYYRHLFLDFDWSPHQFTYRSALPGPTVGELLVDRYDHIEWRSVPVQNSFGDRFSVSVRGSLLITDLRVIFLPVAVSLPFRALSLVLTDTSTIDEEKLVLYHKYTLQMMLSTIAEARSTGNVLSLELVNGQAYEFTALPLPFAVPCTSLYFKGLSPCGDASAWTARVADYLAYEARADSCWLRWAKHMKRTALSLGRAFLKRAKSPYNIDTDYKRLYVHDLNWRLSDLNSSYHLCPTYPSVLVFPGHLSDDDIIGAASQRSIGRLPALVWLHPETRAPLCRASQPMAGLSGSLDYDKKILMSMRASCPKILRIADARPKLNANANAMQGKGFENVSFLGGPSAVALVFLDIDNIHVMRHSLSKLHEAFTDTEQPDHVTNSKWAQHVAGLLRGACSVADSLTIGHPVLVHCSDGWDRTAQLTTLAQILLDPYYRTIEGVLVLIQKEWCAFGHKFEDRLNRLHSKEASPVFLQFLDALYQLVQQFPSSFEYTDHFLLIVVFAMQSGAFATFRGNNERERILMTRSGVLFEDTVSEDMDCTSLTFYIHLLLRTANHSLLATNSQYTPPSADERKVKYIRPACNNHDMLFWKEGLFGMNHNVLEMNSLTGPRIAVSEAAAVTEDLLARFMIFSDAHGVSNPESAPLQEILKACPYPCGAFNKEQQNIKQRSLASALSKSASYLYPRKLLFTGEKALAAILLRSRITAILPDEDDHFIAKAHSQRDAPSDEERDSMEERFDSNVCPDSDLQAAKSVASVAYVEMKRKTLFEHAAVTVQLWFRSLMAARLAVILSNIASVDYFNTRPWGSSFSRKQKKRVVAFMKVFMCLSLSHLKGKRSEKDYLLHSRAKFMRSIIEETVANAIDIAQRELLAFELAANMLQTMGMGDTGSLSPQMSPVNSSSMAAELSPKGSGAKKYLSSRLLRPFIGGPSDGRSLSPMPQQMHEADALMSAEEANADGLEVSPAGKAPGSTKSFTRRMMGGFIL